MERASCRRGERRKWLAWAGGSSLILPKHGGSQRRTHGRWLRRILRMAVVISDASPLVHLATIKRFELLKLLYGELFVPKAVWDEVTVAGRGRPGSMELETANK